MRKLRFYLLQLKFVVTHNFGVLFRHYVIKYFRNLSESEESENSDYSPSEERRGSSKKKKKFKRIKKLPSEPKPTFFREIRTRKKEVKYVCSFFIGPSFFWRIIARSNRFCEESSRRLTLENREQRGSTNHLKGLPRGLKAQNVSILSPRLWLKHIIQTLSARTHAENSPFWRKSISPADCF